MQTPNRWANYNDGAVALPARQFAADEPGAWPYPTGGPGGSIDIPQRDNADLPAQPPRAPVAAGGLGNQPWPGNVAVFDSPLDFSTYGRRNATPFGSLAIHYLRRFVSTGAAVVAQYAQPKPATTGGTLNTVADLGGPVSPIPVFRRFIVETLCDPWGQGRLYQDYYDPPDVVKPAGVRRQLARNQIPRMGDPYQPRLTRLPTTVGADAPRDLVLTPGGSTAFPFNPYAGK